MHLDVLTLAVVTISAASVTGLLLIFSWLQNRGMLALAWWGASFLISAAGAALLFARGIIPETLSNEVANALILITYGMIWNAARVFDGRSVLVWSGLAGALIWLAVFRIEPFNGSEAIRIMLVSAVIGTYSALTAFEIWRGRTEPLMSRWPAVFLLLLHALVFFARMLAASWLPVPAGADVTQSAWLGIATFETLFFLIGLSFTVVMMAKERTQLQHRKEALIDPLTGVLNRRAFMAQAERLLDRRAAAALPTAALVFDLDDFKQINDRFGHQAGDDALVEFCAGVAGHLGPDPIFGRMGGEEFACLLPSASLQHAVQVAERMRAALERNPIGLGAATFSMTVSIGVAVTDQDRADLRNLLSAADRMLYRTKGRGRNRTEWEAAETAPRVKLAVAAG